MKKISLILLLGIIWLSPTAKAMTKDFEDENFYKCIMDTLKQDANTDVSDESLNTITTLSCANKNITSTKGIEKLPNLTSLTLIKNNLTTVDLSKNPNLLYAILNDNNIQTIQYTNNAKLQNLALMNNKITSIDVSNLSGLKDLYLSGNEISSLNVSNNPLLRNLQVEQTNLSTLDLSQNPELVNVRVNETKITTLDLSNNTKLNYLNISKNAMKTLKLSEPSNLATLIIDYKMAKSSDFTNLKALTRMKVMDENIIPIYGSKYDIAKLKEKIPNTLTYSDEYSIYYTDKSGEEHKVLDPTTFNYEFNTEVNVRVADTNVSKSDILINDGVTLEFEGLYTILPIKITSERYAIDEETNTITTNSDSLDEILKNITANLENVTLDITENTLSIKYNGTVIKEFTLKRTGTTQNEALRCTEKDGLYYDKSGNRVEKEAYYKSCGVVENPKTGTILPILLIPLFMIGVIIYKTRSRKFYKI